MAGEKIVLSEEEIDTLVIEDTDDYDHVEII